MWERQARGGCCGGRTSPCISWRRLRWSCCWSSVICRWQGWSWPFRITMWSRESWVRSWWGWRILSSSSPPRTPSSSPAIRSCTIWRSSWWTWSCRWRLRWCSASCGRGGWRRHSRRSTWCPISSPGRWLPSWYPHFWTGPTALSIRWYGRGEGTGWSTGIRGLRFGRSCWCSWTRGRASATRRSSTWRWSPAYRGIIMRRRPWTEPAGFSRQGI